MQSRVFVSRGDAHETDNREIVVTQAFLDKRICLSRHYAGFLRLLASVYLNKQFGTTVLTLHFLRQPNGKLFSIKRLDDIEEFNRIRSFIGL